MENEAFELPPEGGLHVMSQLSHRGAPDAVLALMTSERGGDAPALSKGLTANGASLTASRCCAARGFAIAGCVLRLGHGILHASVVHAALHCTSVPALCIWGCFACAGLHWICTAALQRGGLHCTCRKLLGFACCPGALWVGTQVRYPLGKLARAVRSKQDKYLSSCFIWIVWGGPWVMHGAKAASPQLDPICKPHQYCSASVWAVLPST